MRKVKVLGGGRILIVNMLLNEMLSELRMIVSNYDVNVLASYHQFNIGI